MRLSDRAGRLGHRPAWRRATRSRWRTRRCSTSCGRAALTAALSASGPSVGLPDGQMGNSEVGHLTLGAGAVVAQAITRINDAIADGALADNDVLRSALTAAPTGAPARAELRRRRALPARAHAHAVIELAAQLGTEELILHCITDGRDTSPTSGVRHLADRRALVRAGGRRADRKRGGPLLRDGPRPPLGAHPIRLRPAGARPRRAPRPTMRPQPPARHTPAARPTSSSPPRSSAKRDASAPATACCA